MVAKHESESQQWQAVPRVSSHPLSARRHRIADHHDILVQGPGKVDLQSGVLSPRSEVHARRPEEVRRSSDGGGAAQEMGGALAGASAKTICAQDLPVAGCEHNSRRVAGQYLI